MKDKLKNINIKYISYIYNYKLFYNKNLFEYSKELSNIYK